MSSRPTHIGAANEERLVRSTMHVSEYGQVAVVEFQADPVPRFRLSAEFVYTNLNLNFLNALKVGPQRLDSICIGSPLKWLWKLPIGGRARIAWDLHLQKAYCHGPTYETPHLVEREV